MSLIKQYYMNLFDSNGICQLCSQTKSGIPHYAIHTASPAIQPTHAAWHKSRGDKVDVESLRVYKEVEAINVEEEEEGT